MTARSCRAPRAPFQAPVASPKMGLRPSDGALCCRVSDTCAAVASARARCQRAVPRAARLVFADCLDAH